MLFSKELIAVAIGGAAGSVFRVQTSLLIFE